MSFWAGVGVGIGFTVVTVVLTIGGFLWWADKTDRFAP